MKFDLKTSGFKSLEKQLNELPNRVLFAVVRPAVSKAMTPVLQTARKNSQAIKDTGLLAKSLGRKTKTYKRTGVVIHIVGPRKGFKQEVTRTFVDKKGRTWTKREMANPANYAHLVEFGTQPHSLGKGSSVRKDIQTQGVMHPGTKAQPWLRPALDTNEKRVTQIMISELQTGIVREALKLKGTK